MANSVDPDQNAPSRAFWSGSALFAYDILSVTWMFEILGHLQYWFKLVFMHVVWISLKAQLEVWEVIQLTLKLPITSAAEDILFSYYIPRKLCLWGRGYTVFTLSVHLSIRDAGFFLISRKCSDGYSSISAGTLISIRCTYIRESKSQGPIFLVLLPFVKFFLNAEKSRKKFVCTLSP